MTKNYNHFKSIKKAFVLVIFVGTLASTGSSFATKEAPSNPVCGPTSFHVKQIEDCTSDYQIKRYVEKLNNDDLKKIYCKILQITLHDPHNLKLLHARQIISKTQSDREFYKITHNSAKLKSKMVHQCTTPLKLKKIFDKPQRKPIHKPEISQK